MSSSTLYPDLHMPQAHRALTMPTVLPNSSPYSDAQRSLTRTTTAPTLSGDHSDNDEDRGHRGRRHHHRRRSSRRHGTASMMVYSSSSSSSSPPHPSLSSISTPLPLSGYMAASQFAISSALKVAMLSTSFGLGIARTVVSGVDQALGKVVKTVTGENHNEYGGLSPSQVTSLPFRAALLGINFSDVLVQTILEAVDGSVNLALSTIQDGMDLVDSLFGNGGTGHGQASETFREVWIILSRELASMNGASYPVLEGLRLFIAYIAIQFATSEAWEAQRIERHCQLVGLCYEALDEQNGSVNSWRAVRPWPIEWQQRSLPSETYSDDTSRHFMSASHALSPSRHVQAQALLPALPVEPSPSSSTARVVTLDSHHHGDGSTDLVTEPPRYHASQADPILECSPASGTEGGDNNIKEKKKQQVIAGMEGTSTDQQSSRSSTSPNSKYQGDDEGEEESLTRHFHRDLLPPPPSLGQVPVVEPTAPLPSGGSGEGNNESDDSVLYPILDWRDQPVPFSRVQTPVLTRRADRMEKLDTPAAAAAAALKSTAANSAVLEMTTEGRSPSSSSSPLYLSAGSQVVSYSQDFGAQSYGGCNESQSSIAHPKGPVPRSLFSDQQDHIHHPPQSQPTSPILDGPATSSNTNLPSSLPLHSHHSKERVASTRSLNDASTVYQQLGGEGCAPPPAAYEPNPELRQFLADSYRFSRFCSAMYGEQVLNWMGSPDIIPPPAAPTSTSGEAQGADGSGVSPVDHHFLAYTGTPLGSILYSSDEAATLRTGAIAEERYYAPRYYVLDDAASKQIVLVLRGTKSLHDLMVDLTCDAADLVLDHETAESDDDIYDQDEDDDDHRLNNTRRRCRKRPYKVHAGFLKAARTMASVDTVGIQERIHWALRDRPDYSLLLIGHSLGAGIASVLTLLWADPTTGFTPPLKSGASEDTTMALPPGRRVRCYAYGSPKVMCPRLSRRSTKLITSISYGDDVVGRLSLGSVRNIGHAMRALLALRPMSASTTTSTDAPESTTFRSMRPPSPPQTPSLVDSEGEEESMIDMEPVDATDFSNNQSRTSAPMGSATRAESSQEPLCTNTNTATGNNTATTATTSIGLEIVQKVIRWRLTKEAHLMEEFVEIRRAMHREMRRFESLNMDDDEEEDDDDILFNLSSSSLSSGNNNDNDNDVHARAGSHTGSRRRLTRRTRDNEDKCPALVPAGKVLWIRPSETEQAIQAQDERKHPVDNVLHQFEWDHPGDYAHHHNHHHPNQHQHQNLPFTDRFKENWKSAGHDVPLPRGLATGIGQDQQYSVNSDNAKARLDNNLGRTDPSSSASSSRPVPASYAPPQRSQHQSDQHQQQRISNRILYRMYATPQPEHVFEEMLFSRRMWSDHLPLTYEFVLAGKHAVPPSSTPAAGNSSSE
ncbi:hypothetical protein BGW42_007323 [Actinomortierella wolfii]|nr:hypothetical protein BGW42_007323 [Actinomortierella wolfii]